MSAIAEALAATRARIERAASAAGRDASSVTLLAVSKRHPAAAIREAYAAGQRRFGENYAQELAAKAAELADLPDLEWHMIGHLQTNKARHVAPVAAMVHAVDSVALARELGKRAAAAGRVVAALAEVNVSGEASKSGCAPAEVAAVLAAIEGERSLRAAGLMTMPPADDDPEAAAPHFAALRALRDAHGGASRLPELSMGMSHDLDVAVREGATIVRVGTAIFGERTG